MQKRRVEEMVKSEVRTGNWTQNLSLFRTEQVGLFFKSLFSLKNCSFRNELILYLPWNTIIFSFLINCFIALRNDIVHKTLSDEIH